MKEEENEESKSVVERRDWRVVVVEGSLILARRLLDALARPRKAVDRRLWPCDAVVVILYVNVVDRWM